jgi:hypothetical protein
VCCSSVVSLAAQAINKAVSGCKSEGETVLPEPCTTMYNAVFGAIAKLGTLYWSGQFQRVSKLNQKNLFCAATSSSHDGLSYQSDRKLHF